MHAACLPLPIPPRTLITLLHVQCVHTDDPSAPSLDIVPVVELYGHLLLLLGSEHPTSNQQATDKTDKAARGPNATQLFAECLARLPNRQSCVLGAARAHASAGDMAAASDLYARFWAQCAGAAAPADFLHPGLLEAFFAIVPAEVASVDLLDSMNTTAAAINITVGSQPPASPSSTPHLLKLQLSQPLPPPRTPSSPPKVYYRQYTYQYGSTFTYYTVPSQYSPPMSIYEKVRGVVTGLMCDGCTCGAGKGVKVL